MTVMTVNQNATQNATVTSLNLFPAPGGIIEVDLKLDRFYIRIGNAEVVAFFNAADNARLADALVAAIATYDEQSQEGRTDDF